MQRPITAFAVRIYQKGVSDVAYDRYAQRKYKQRYPGNTTVMKHSLPEAPTEGEMGDNDKTDATYKSTYAQKKTNCKRKAILERSEDKVFIGRDEGG